MDIATLLIQLASGALGGNAASNYAKDTGLGTVGNTIAGALGGGIGGQILNALLGLGGTAAASGLDIGTIVSGFATGGIMGGLTALAIGFLKSKMGAWRACTIAGIRSLHACSRGAHEYVRAPCAVPRQRDWYVTAPTPTCASGVRPHG